MLLSCVDQAHAAGIPVGALSMDSRFIGELFAHSLNFLAYGIDTILMYQHCRAITGELNQICASNLRRKEPEL